MDRGGPLTVADSKSGAHTLVGAVSVGYGCTRAGEGAEGPTSMVIIIMMMIIAPVCATFEYSNMSKCVISQSGSHQEVTKVKMGCMNGKNRSF